MSDTAIVGFNYDALDAKDRKGLQTHAQAIRGLLQGSSKSVVEIGKRLIAVRDKFGGTAFQAWLKAEFRWTQATASNFMRVADRFGDLDCISQFQPSALYELAKARVDKKAVAAAVSQAKDGAPITKRIAREIADKHSAKKCPTRGVTDSHAAAITRPSLVSTLRAQVASLCDSVDKVDATIDHAERLTLAAELERLAAMLRGLHPEACAPRTNGRKRRELATAQAGN